MRMRLACLLAVIVAASVCSKNAMAGNVTVEAIFTAPATVPINELVPPPSPTQVSLFAGQPRIANDGTWYALYRFPVSNPNDPFEFTRNFSMLRDGVPYIREGLQITNSPTFVPVADLTSSQQPFFDVSIASDGTVAQIVRGTDQFTVLPDGTANPFDFDFEDNKFDLVVIDRSVVLTQGTPLDIIPGLLPPDNALQEFSTVKAASANRILVKSDLSAGGTFDPETLIIFEITDPGLPSQTETLRFTDDDSINIPDLGFNISTTNSNEEDIDYNADGSILLGIDIQGAPTSSDGAIVLYNAPLDTYQLLAREGAISPLAGRVYDDLFNNPLALNDAGDYAFLASVNGSTSDDGIIVVNDQVVIQEAATVGTAVPGALQLGFANANIEMDAAGNVIWYGAWNAMKADVCPDNTDITSSFAIFEGLFFNDELLIEGGVTEVHNVTVGGTFFPTMVVADLPNTGFAGFHVSPDGRWLIVHALLAEPDPDICAFSINNNATPVAQVLLRVDLASLATVAGDMNCDGVLSFADLGPLALALVDPTEYAIQFPDCAILNGDFNDDGVIDGRDIDGFIGALAG